MLSRLSPSSPSGYGKNPGGATTLSTTWVAREQARTGHGWDAVTEMLPGFVGRIHKRQCLRRLGVMDGLAQSIALRFGAKDRHHRKSVDRRAGSLCASLRKTQSFTLRQPAREVL